MTKETVYIIGAGASCEAGLPSGEKLKDEIVKLLDFRYHSARLKQPEDSDVLSAIRRLDSKDYEFNHYFDACQHICRCMPLAKSIDSFLDTQRGNEKLAVCGKLAIAKSIINAEAVSLLKKNLEAQSQSIEFSELENTWYPLFFRSLTENCDVDDLIERFQAITLIIFNYDRCIEHFLLNALRVYYRLSQDRAAKIISELTIIHPYGTVGSLPWQRKSINSICMSFGGNSRAENLVQCAKKIRTFTEEVKSKEVNELREKVNSARRMIFLGFAFHSLNMDLIRPRNDDINTPSSNVECYATAYGVSESDQRRIKDSIHSLPSSGRWPAIEMANITCEQFFRDYAMSVGYT